MKYYNNLPKKMREEYEESFKKAMEDLKQRDLQQEAMEIMEASAQLRAEQTAEDLHEDSPEVYDKWKDEETVKEYENND